MGKATEEDLHLIHVEAGRYLRGLAEVWRQTTDPDLIGLFLSSISSKHDEQRLQAAIGAETRKRRADVDQRDGETTGSKRTRNDKDKHSTDKLKKGKRLVYTEMHKCELCERVFGSERSLKTHFNTNHAGSSVPDTTPKSKCKLCTENRPDIYIHYESVHKITKPEQILFFNGDLLVHGLDTNGGKAQWFLNEKERAMQRCDAVTCRLCKTEEWFQDSEKLESHYTLVHMVDPGMLKKLERIFRAEEGAHIPGFTSVTSKRKRQLAPTQTTEPISVNGRMRWLCKHCNGTYSNKANLQRHIKESCSDSKSKGKFPCQECEQVCNTESLLNKHYNEEHTRKTKTDPRQCFTSKSKKSDCEFCEKNLADTYLYTHYGHKHKVDYPEELLFFNGNVLVYSDIDTDGGKAPWFLREREKAIYTSSTCRLCDIEQDSEALLEEHLVSEHSIIPRALYKLKYMFRAAKNAHKVDSPASGTPQGIPNSKANACGSAKTETKYKCKAAGTSKAHQSKPSEERETVIIYRCKECGIHTIDYDASIEHAQLHHLGDYTPTPALCDICELTFEAHCLIDHFTIHGGQHKILHYNPKDLLSHEWFNLFKDLPTLDASRINSSSCYQYTRALKINCDEVSGIPVYICDICKTSVDPKEVEGHCKNDCSKNSSRNLYCSECDVSFDTAAILATHSDQHQEGFSFRRATFNLKQDAPINKALRAASNARPEHPKGRQEIHDISGFCDICRKSIVYSEFEAHSEAHRVHYAATGNEVNQGLEDSSEGLSSSESLGGLSGNSGDFQNEAFGIEAEINAEGSVEPWNSDDSCQSFQVLTSEVEVQVHDCVMEDNNRDRQTETTDNVNNVCVIDGEITNTGSDVYTISSHDQKNEDTDEYDFIVLTNELRRDLYNM